MKTCTKCLISKNLSDFGKKSSYPDGHQYWCKGCFSLYKKEYFVKNLEKSRTSRLSWAKKNAETKRIYQRQYLRKKRISDPVFRAIKNIRSRTNQFIHENNINSFSRKLGCSKQEFKKHIESKFQPGMSWGNYGEWHIDHVLPLSKHKELNTKLETLCKFNNLQPLWSYDNRVKSNRI